MVIVRHRKFQYGQPGMSVVLDSLNLFAMFVPDLDRELLPDRVGEKNVGVSLSSPQRRYSHLGFTTNRSETDSRTVPAGKCQVPS